jgi:hypothetical protein
MMFIDPLKNIEEQCLILFSGDALLKDASCTAVIQLTVVD